MNNRSNLIKLEKRNAKEGSREWKTYESNNTLKKGGNVERKMKNNDDSEKKSRSLRTETKAEVVHVCQCVIKKALKKQNWLLHLTVLFFNAEKLV